MTWFRVDDGFHDHPKVLRLLEHSARWPHALALWLLAGTWCSKQLTDGEIPAVMVTRLGFTPEDAEALVTVGLWKRSDHGFRFHEWTSRNPTRKQVETKRAKNRKKVTEWRSNHPRNQVTSEHSNETGNPAPVPSRPVPSEEAAAAPDEPDEQEPESGLVARATRAAPIQDVRIEPEDVSRAWHKALTQPGGGDLLTMHAVNDWRAEYGTIATVLNRLPPDKRWIALDAVCQWFWLASDGPIQTGRIQRVTAGPGHLSKRISSDLKSANDWFVAQQHDHPTHGAMAS